MHPIQILVADPHPLVRDIAAHRFAEVDGFQVIGTTASGADTLQAVSDCRPDVLLLGLDFQDVHGVRVITMLRNRQEPIQIIALGDENSQDYIRCVLGAGADAYLLKDEANDLLADTITRLEKGERGWFRPAPVKGSEEQ